MSYPQIQWINIGITYLAKILDSLARQTRGSLADFCYSQLVIFRKLDRNGQAIF